MPEQAQLQLLLVDDDPSICRAYGGVLARHGASVETCTNGHEAIERVKTTSFDVVVSDIAMPEMTGIALLSAVRQYDHDVPVILMTGSPSLESAVRAVEYGAFRYLMKPVTGSELWSTVQRAGTLHKLAKVKREALELTGSEKVRIGERAALEQRFASAVNLSWIACQPIVGWQARRVFGYEVTLRSDDPLMRTSADILDAAERLGRLDQLGRTLRAKVAKEAASLPAGKLFMNVHTIDLNDEELYDEEAPLSKIASRVVLEVTERTSLYGVRSLASDVAKLKALGFEIAIDNLGSGYSGMASFTQLDPELAKLDLSLVHDVDTDARRQSIIRSIKALCSELGIAVIAEGVETPAERDTLVRLGCDLLQGYLFAKPERGFREPRW